MKKIKYRSIETLIFAIISAALIPAFIIIVISGVQLISNTVEDAQAEVLRKVDVLSMEQIHYVERIQALLENLKHSAMVLYDRPEVLKTLYSLVLRDHPELANITLTDEQGLVVVSSKLPPGFSVADRKHIQVALQRSGFIAGNYIKNYATGEASIAFAESFFTGQGKKFIQAIVFTVKNYKDVLPLEILDEDAFCGVTDSDGIRLFTWPEQPIFPSGQPVTPHVWEVMKNADSADVAVFKYADGVERLIAYKPLLLPGSDTPYLYIVYGRPYSSFFKPIIVHLSLQLIVFAGFLALTFVIAGALTQHHIGRPVHEVIKQINMLEMGNYAARSSLENKQTDIGKIALALDEMAEGIEVRNAELEASRKHLEKLLAEKDIILREVHHRIKNNLQVILSLMDIEIGKKHDIEAFVDAIRARIMSLVNVYEMVYVSGNSKAIDFKLYIESLVTFICGDLYGFPEHQVVLDLEEVLVPVDRALLLGLVIQELIINSIKYGVRNLEDTISISLAKHGDKYILSIKDPGKQFRLSAEAMQKGAGLILVDSLIKQLDAKISWNYEQGTACSIEFS